MASSQDVDESSKADPNREMRCYPANQKQCEPDTGSSRRSILKAAVLGASGVAMGMTGGGIARANTDRHGIQFDQVVDLVEDFGADPTGTDPVDSAVKQAAQADTLVMVPDGEYLFSGEVLISPEGNVGFLAKEGASPRFVAPDGHNDYLLNVYHLPKALFEGIDIDLERPDTTAGLRFDIEDKVHVQQVEFIGRGTHPDARVTDALNVTVTNATGTGTIKNVTALRGSAIGHYKSGNGRVGVFVGQNNYGTIRIEDCHLEEFGNNGLYCSRTPGAVEVIGGTYRNNNVAGVRVGGTSSYVKGAVVEVDLDAYSGPMTQQGTAYNTRCVVLEQNNVTKTPGATVRDCDIRVTKADNSQAAIHLWGWTGEQSGVIKNTRVQVDVDGVPAVFGDESQVVMDGTSLTGAAAEGTSMVISGVAASESAVKNSCIEQPGSGRDGCLIKDATDCVMSDSNVNVSGEILVLDGGTANTTNITTDDSCPLPQIGLSVSTGETTRIAGSSATLTGSLNDLGGADELDLYFEWGESGTDLPNSTSRVTVSEPTTVEADVSDLQHASEHVFRLVAITASGDTVSGDVKRFTTKDLPNSVSIEGGSENDKIGYEFTVSGDLVKSTTNDATIDDNDGISGTTATGQVAGGVDTYDYSGYIQRFQYDGPLTITRNDTTFPVSEWLNLPNSIVFDGTTADSKRSYSFEVSETLAPDPTVGTVDETDEIGDSHVEGQVNGGVDAFRYAGEIRSLTTEEDIAVSLEDTDG